MAIVTHSVGVDDVTLEAVGHSVTVRSPNGMVVEIWGNGKIDVYKDGELSHSIYAYSPAWVTV